MTSVASAGTTDRITARNLLKVERAGSGTLARYSSTVLGARLPLAVGPRLSGIAFFIRGVPQAFSSRLLVYNCATALPPLPAPRSEEHTSELQSLRHLV